MRTTFLRLFTLSLLSACGEDTTTGGTQVVNGDATDGVGDGALGTDATSLSDTLSGGDGTSGDTTSSDTNGGTDTAGTGFTCTQVGQCIEDACQKSGPPCGMTCAVGVTPDVAAKLDALTGCVAAKCQNGLCKGNITTKCMNDCTGSQCGTLLTKCFDDGMPGGNPCNSALTCFEGCDKTAITGHFTCMSKCFSGLSKLGKLQLQAFTDCLAKTDGGSAGFAACQSEYTTCATGGTTGNGTCADISKCAANCPASSATCGGDCLALGSAQAQTQINEMNACFAGNPNNQAPCLAKLEACAAPSGTGKCNGINACTETCKKGFAGGDDKGTCTIGCLHQASKGAADAFIALFTCVIPNCPDCIKGDATCQTCLNAKCASQLNACLAN